MPDTVPEYTIPKGESASGTDGRSLRSRRLRSGSRVEYGWGGPFGSIYGADGIRRIGGKSTYGIKTGDHLNFIPSNLPRSLHEAVLSASTLDIVVSWWIIDCQTCVRH